MAPAAVMPMLYRLCWGREWSGIVSSFIVSSFLKKSCLKISFSGMVTRCYFRAVSDLFTLMRQFAVLFFSFYLQLNSVFFILCVETYLLKANLT
jgi:hypothetical protein